MEWLFVACAKTFGHIFFREAVILIRVLTFDSLSWFMLLPASALFIFFLGEMVLSTACFFLKFPFLIPRGEILWEFLVLYMALVCTCMLPLGEKYRYVSLKKKGKKERSHRLVWLGGR